jgi:hypothetical protein
VVPASISSTVVRGFLRLGLVASVATLWRPMVLRAQTAARDQEVRLAVAALPEPLRADAKVLGYRSDGSMTVLRPGAGLFVCLARNPKETDFHVVCYHRDLDPFMARGRELRAQKRSQAAVDSTRLAEIKSGALKMPSHPAALYHLMAKAADVNAAAGTVAHARSMYVIYTPYATSETSGLSVKPGPGPWLMDPGLPWAHVMISP